GATQLVLSMATVIEKYGSYGGDPTVQPSHPDFSQGFPPVNRCFEHQGLPYGTSAAIYDALPPAVGSAALVDDRNPGLVLYEADASGTPSRLAGIGLGKWLIQTQPTIEGTNWMSDYEWEGHWGGWHTNDGGMTVIDAQFGSTILDDWRTPGQIPPLDCGERGSFCGVGIPYIPHPALWDAHVFFPKDGTLPTVTFAANADAGLAGHTCEAIAQNATYPMLKPCDAGVPSGPITPFFVFDDAGNPQVTQCN
ncbi:MAG: hypothetical protein HKN42_03795, partial [Granulosicoccus sp.]|nr:hypothetical protein [Granulosicoccus sp.]